MNEPQSQVRLDPIGARALERLQDDLRFLGFGEQEVTGPQIVSALLWATSPYAADGMIRAFVQHRARGGR